MALEAGVEEHEHADPVDSSTADAGNGGWGGALPPLATLVAALASISGGQDADGGDADGPDAWSYADTAELEELRLTLAIELEVRTTPGGAPRVTGSTPTQWTSTTVLPVFHSLSLRLTRRTDDA